MTKSETLVDLATQFGTEYEKFEGGNNSAGTRARKLLQQIKTTAGDYRKEIQDARGSAEKEAA